MCCRFVFVLVFMCVADTEARVVNNFDDCPQFFFKRAWPDVLKITDKSDYKYICQQYEGHTHFATLYMLEKKIPLFSAYRLDNFLCKNQHSKRSYWFVEPQLNPRNEGRAMTLEGQCKDCTKFQAANEDYRNTNFDKGHLNPASYQCDVEHFPKNKLGRTATFTLTNAVPQDPCFNRQQWKNAEQMSKQIMHDECNNYLDERFFVTGVIPSNPAISIPFRYEHDEADNQQREFEKVHVPYAMWTAACCYHSTDRTGFSFGYIGINSPESRIQVISIPQLRTYINDYDPSHEVKIFSEDCFPHSSNSEEYKNKLINWLNSKQPNHYN